MSVHKNYSYYIEPGNRMRQVAGPYDVETKKPHYTIQVECPSHVRNQVKQNTFLIGNPDNCSWAWEVLNNSSWPVFVTVKKEGKILK